MKSFKQYIEEKRVPLVQKRSTGWTGTVAGLENPSERELIGFINRPREKMARFIVNKKDLLCWDASDAIHADVIHGEGWNKRETGQGVIYIYRRKNEKENTIEVEITKASSLSSGQTHADSSRTLAKIKANSMTNWQVK